MYEYVLLHFPSIKKFESQIFHKLWQKQKAATCHIRLHWPLLKLGQERERVNCDVDDDTFAAEIDPVAAVLQRLRMPRIARNVSSLEQGADCGGKGRP